MNIKKTAPNSKGSVKFFQLDLAKRASVQYFSQKIQKQFSHIDILINNAGLMANDRQLNQLGIEMTMAVNHFGHFLLTYLLFHLVKKSKQARIINLTSKMHNNISQSTIEDLSAQKRFGSIYNYQKSKLANVQFTTGLALKLIKYTKIKVMCLHPGSVNSEIGSNLFVVNLFKFFCCLKFVDNQAGAKTSLFLSRQSFSELKSGEYYDSNTKLREMNPLGKNKQHVEALWKQSERIYNIKFEI